jgi:hypothetical protein
MTRAIPSSKTKNTGDSYRDSRNISSRFMADAFPLWLLLTAVFGIASLVASCTLCSICCRATETYSCSGNLSIACHRCRHCGCQKRRR